MLLAFDLFHDVVMVSFSNVLLNVWDNDLVISPLPYFMNSFFISSGPVLLLFLSDVIASCAAPDEIILHFAYPDKKSADWLIYW